MLKIELFLKFTLIFLLTHECLGQITLIREPGIVSRQANDEGSFALFGFPRAGYLSIGRDVIQTMVLSLL